MKYIYLPIIFIFVFFAISIVFMRAMFPIAERLRTMELDGTAEPPAYFPLLVKSSEKDSTYRVEYFKDLSPNDVTTTYIDKSAVQSINKQIGNKANTPSGKILSLNSGDGFTDLWLEARNPEWVRGWYRIEDGKVIPQKYHMYTRGIVFGFGLFILVGAIVLASVVVSFVNKMVVT